MDKRKYEVVEITNLNRLFKESVDLISISRVDAVSEVEETFDELNKVILQNPEKIKCFKALVNRN